MAYGAGRRAGAASKKLFTILLLNILEAFWRPFVVANFLAGGAPSPYPFPKIATAPQPGNFITFIIFKH